MNGSTYNYRLMWHHFQSGEQIETYLDDADAKMLTDHILKMSQDSTLQKVWMVWL